MCYEALKHEKEQNNTTKSTKCKDLSEVAEKAQLPTNVVHPTVFPKRVKYSEFKFQNSLGI